MTPTASNDDEICMQQSLLFSDSLKDLKNLGSQLYSAAEYFELSYTNDDQKLIVVDTLKDYAIKAIVNTVGHLGSLSYKVNDLLDEKVDEVSGSELSVSCIEQRLRTCKEYIDHEGLSQQSLIMNAPKYHKRYILSAGVTMHGAINAKSIYRGHSLHDEDDWHHFKNSIIRGSPTPGIRKGRSPSPSPRPSQKHGNFSFPDATTKKEIEKRTVSPHRFPLLRSGSCPSRPTTPDFRRPATPNDSAARWYPSEPQKLSSVGVRTEKERSKDIERYPSKSKRLLKALLSRRKTEKDDMLYAYLDEY